MRAVGTLARSWVAVALALGAGAACGAPPRDTRERDSNFRSVLDEVGAKASDTPERIVDYVVRVANLGEAAAHTRAVRVAGGTVVALDAEGRILRVTAHAGALRGIALPTGASLTPNARVTLTRSPASLEAVSADALDGLFTAREALGVDALAARVPEADGRFATVAVMDTGIDFDIPGVSDAGKLVGFYDLTGFGTLTPSPLAPRVDPNLAYEVGQGKTLRVGSEIAPASVTAGGVIDELALARAGLLAEYDINGNGSASDVFAYAVGQNADGKPALWLDLNQNGIIDSRGAEEMTDFNTTFRTVDARRGSNQGTRRIPLAVTLGADGGVQLHSLASSSSHGTQCASIVAGDGLAGGRIRGMAPKAKLVSYLLDAGGQDVYTLDQLVRMFVHAKTHGVDAISISYGFARGDLASARWFADFVDTEIASAGILVGIAAGNEGPAIASATADDYVPHNGFSVGAAVTPRVAQTVYGWTRATENDVVHYSSAGPTAGGRAVPDVVSPFMNLAKRTSVSAFSGTSSATPALMGGIATIVSALKAQGITPIDARLMKLAITSTARVIIGRGGLEQGAGLVDVDSAFTRYLSLTRESFIPDLRASTASGAEGVVVHDGAPQAASVAIAAVNPGADASLRATPVALIASHESAFFDLPPAVLMTNANARFALQFDRTKLGSPGVYTDVITLRRASDGLPLLRVPVVVTVPVAAPAQVGTALAALDATLAPQRTWRMPVHLTEPTSLRLDAVVAAGGGPGTTASLLGAIVATNGTSLPFFRKNVSGAFATIAAQSEELAAGDYEVLVVRTASPTSTFAADVRVTGALRTAPARIVGTSVDATAVTFAATSNEALSWNSVELALTETRESASLVRGVREGREGFAGTLVFDRAVDGVRLTLSQPSVQAATSPFLNAEVTLGTDDKIYDRLWVAFGSNAAGGHVSATSLAQAAATPIHVFAYPNIVRWATNTTPSLTLSARADLVGIAAWAAPLAQVAQAVPGVPFIINIPLAGRALPAHASGTLALKNGTTVEAVLPVELP